MKNYLIIDTNKDGSGNIVLGEYKDERVAEERALEIAQKSGMEILVCEKKTSIKADITDRVKTYEDACRIVNAPLNGNEKDTEDESAYKALKVIVKALNEGWEPDWNDTSQYKYHPWFRIERDNTGASAGLAYSNSYDAVANTYAYIGSRLCFKTEALARYAGEQFLKLWEKYLI